MAESNLSTSRNFVLCNNGKQLSVAFLDDLYPDCGPDAEDELILRKLLENNTISLCRLPSELHCRQGHSVCYNVTHICVYKLNSLSNLMPCRSGKHLMNCFGFECNTMFKCPSAYCIPWSYVCDFKTDCPEAFDESHEHVCQQFVLCQHMFACQGSQQCVHLYDVCNGQKDCPLGEDEMVCGLKDVTCPKECQCLLYAMKCQSLTQEFQGNYPHRSLTILHSDAGFFFSVMHSFEDVLYLRLSKCNLSQICPIGLKSLLSLSVQRNLITRIEHNCFPAMHQIKTLFLNSNRIKYVHSQGFSNLTKLLLLDMSGNPLTSFPENGFQGLLSMKLLVLQKVPIVDINFNVFDGLNMQFLDTTRFQLCCLVPIHSNCSADILWYHSCKYLFSKREIKVVFITLSVWILCTNTASIVLTAVKTESAKAFVVIMVAIGANFNLIGLYQTVIWTFDTHWGDIFS